MRHNRKMSDNDNDAFKYLLTLERVPSYYEVFNASSEELEERVSCWQDQIFTLAGQLQDLTREFGELKNKNQELESELKVRISSFNDLVNQTEIKSIE